MNTFSLIKLFTLVGFLVLSRGALAATEVAYEDCVKKMDVTADCKPDQLNDYQAPAGANQLSPSALKDACRKAQEPKYCENNPTRADLKDKANECKASLKTYRDAATKGKMACAAFEKGKVSESTPGAQCTKVVANCRAQLASQFTPSSSDKSSTEILEAIALQSIQQKMGVTGTPATNSASSCVDEPDSKEQKQNAKDKEKQISEYEADIKKEAQEQSKLIKDQDKDLNKIKKDENEIVADAVKKANDRTKKERDQTAEINKSTLESSKRLRGYGAAIVQEQQKLASERLAYQTAMLNLSSERISMKCKQEFELAKNGIVSAASGGKDLTPEQKTQFGSLLSQCKGQVNCSAQMQTFLEVAKKACFESANSKVSELTLGSNQKIQNINARIDELQAQIKDEATIAANNKAAIDDVKKGLTDEEAADQAEKSAKLAALNDEVISFNKSTATDIAISKQHAAELTDKIMKLKLNTNFNSKLAFSDAEGMIKTSEDARVSAVADCSCEGSDVDPKNKAICSTLADDKVDLKAGSKKPSSKN